MKRTLALLILIYTPVLAIAQGTVVLNNQSGLVKQWTSWSDSTLINVPKGGGYVQLFAAPHGTPLQQPLFMHWASGIFVNYNSLAAFLSVNPGWSPAYKDSGSLPVQITAVDGIFAGGTYTIMNIAAGAPADYFLVGWTGNYVSFDEALTAAFIGIAVPMFGESPITTTTTGDPTATPPGVPVPLKNTFPGMTLAGLGIPEPGSLALVGLGAAVLMRLRRSR